MAMLDGTGRYLNQLGRVPLLTAEQEIEWVRAVQAWLHAPNLATQAIAAGQRA